MACDLPNILLFARYRLYLNFLCVHVQYSLVLSYLVVPYYSSLIMLISASNESEKWKYTCSHHAFLNKHIDIEDFILCTHSINYHTERQRGRIVEH